MIGRYRDRPRRLSSTKPEVRAAPVPEAWRATGAIVEGLVRTGQLTLRDEREAAADPDRITEALEALARGPRCDSSF